ncbi:MAG: sirohydrochlorin cobaltochelatase [Peptococcaceae bacterium]|jgi:sirohydrochlorin cobaltochelatase|nr:sirohydrochlorin cobaltochelatase [Peptococcaceae bacterium]MDH7525805.1 sirohydrochlorin cobaltochelatase [Peptococcaceae bacterium]
MKTGQKKKAILVVSFGTTHHDACKVTIEACEEEIARRFPGYETRRAFTSNIIRKTLKERDGMEIDDTGEALRKLKEEGFGEVIVQPLHIIPGEEYHEKVLKPAAPYREQFERLVVGRTVLAAASDYAAAAEALKRQLPRLDEDQAVVLMGHGSDHPANACYAMLQLVLMATLPRVFIAGVEGYPGIGDVVSRLKAGGIKKVVLMPYMLVAGEHAKNDLAGDEDDSWKKMLEREGFEVSLYLHGLGENPAYREIFVRRVADCLKAAEAAGA